jgi:CBS domain-containing protein
MTKLAQDVMTANPACCSPETSLDQVARLMVQHDCGEIPVIDIAEHVVGVVTDRDIVCRVVAEGKNPTGYPAESCMTDPVVTVPWNAPLREVLTAMEKHQVRRVPVVDATERCVGMISQADVAWVGREQEVAELVREVSRDSGLPSR